MLTGGDTEAIRQWGHNELSTYGIGREIKRDGWQAIGRELLRLGLVEVAPGKFATLQVTAAGRAALRGRTPITLTKQVEKPPAKVKQRAGEINATKHSSRTSAASAVPWPTRATCRPMRFSQTWLCAKWRGPIP